jgi:uncharacterized protein with HEPN domain
MSRRSDTVYLRHMLDHAQTAVTLSVGKNRSSLDTEPVLRYALLHLVAILGEAANRVSPDSRSTYSQIPWRDMTAMRNMLIHGYDVGDFDVLWKTVEEDIPALITALSAILDGEDGS